VICKLFQYDNTTTQTRANQVSSVNKLNTETFLLHSAETVPQYIHTMYITR